MQKILSTILLLYSCAGINCSCALAADAARVLPPDIDPESLSRLPIIHKYELDADGQRVFEFIMGRDADTPNIGPAAVSLYNTRVAEAMQMLNQEVRYHSVIGRRYTELAVLVASRELDQQYEWTMHEDTAREEGVTPAAIDTVKYNRETGNLDRVESVIIRFGRQIFRQHRLDSDLFTEAVGLFGRRGTFELTAIMGDYAMAAVMLHAIDQRLAPDHPAKLPIAK